MPACRLSFWFAVIGTPCCQHAVDEDPELAFVGEVHRSAGSEVLDASPMVDLGCPGARLQLDDEGAVGGQRHVFLGHGAHSRATTWFMVSVPRRSRSREDGRAFHLRRRVFDSRRWTFAPRSRSVVGGRVDQRQLGLRRAEVGRVVAFGETAQDLAEQLVGVG